MCSLILLLAATWPAAPLQETAPVSETEDAAPGAALPQETARRIVASGQVDLGAGVFPDPEGDGALRIEGDDLVIDFAKARLRGAEANTRPDAYAGTGVVITGQRVTVRNLVVSGYRVGLRAEGCEGLVLEDCDVSDNFRQHLGSTPDREDGKDWLWPHDNDGGEWARNYGAGILVRDGKDVTIRRCRAREVQNGLLLERVSDSRVYDNDFSFLSGWGIALWRSSDNVIARNACDYCIRGYSHGVYNRGQDSAGLLLFEQCSRNVIAENSATHSGDGIFAFAGQEALGARDDPPEIERLRLGNNDNLFLRNDLSYAAAHGLELTFSFGNRVHANRMVGNAICGFWGGYSRDTILTQNLFEANGEAGYGLERGGVNIEHGQRNYVTGNSFLHNRCGVHLWWDADEHLASLPWSSSNGHACELNVVVGNSFEGDAVGLELRTCSSTILGENTFTEVERERLVEGEEPTEQAGGLELPPLPDLTLPGNARPVGARALGGRESIVMTPWGPYAHDRPYLARRGTADASHRWSLLGAGLEEWTAPESVEVRRLGERELIVRPKGPGVTPYRLTVATSEGEVATTATFVRTAWEVRLFAWEEDPEIDPENWRREGQAAPPVTLPELNLSFRDQGPFDLVPDDALAPLSGRTERFGLLAQTRLTLPAGRWRLRTLSDDGLRVRVDGEVVLEDWTVHGTRALETVLERSETRDLELEVEYFERHGGARLLVELEPAEAPR